MKKIYLIAATAAMFAACTSNDKLEVQTPEPQPTVEANAVSFDAYTQRGVTRSGDIGTMTTETANTLKLKDTGFGVFGYYTDNNEYDGQSMPNFFYNQKITWDNPVASQWGYDPVKYWPNEYGSSAIADDADKVSYFAYAPFVSVAPATGKAQDQTYGITQLSRNSATGDPYVKYIASFDWAKNVDLLWGVVPAANTSWNIVAGESQTLAAGKPWLDVQRPTEAATQAAANQRIKFDFRHALSKLNVVVDYDADASAHQEDAASDLGASTRVYIRSVSFTGFTLKGALNLNNTVANTPLWMSYDAQSDLELGEEIVINDGRKDGREGASGSAAANEKNPFINPALIQTAAWASDNKGVLNKAQNLFKYPGADAVAADMKLATPTGEIDATAIPKFAEAIGEAAAADWDYTDPTNAAAILNWPVMVIPTGEELKVTIVYDVETVDKNLAVTLGDGLTQGSSIENKITKTITLQGDKNYMEAGKKYTIKLHLGLNSVKFDAAVTEWDATVINGESWLPENLTSYQAPGNYNYSVLASKTGDSETFQLTGFSPNEAVTATTNGDLGGVTNASAAGIIAAAKLLNIAPSTSVLNVTTADYAKFTGNSSGKEVVINLVQLAALPDNTQSTLVFAGATGTFTLKDAASTALTGAVWTGDTRNVTIVSATRNGNPMTELDENATPSGSLQFKCSNSAGEITLGSAATAGEVFIFVIKAGDAKEVTVKCTVA